MLPTMLHERGQRKRPHFTIYVEHNFPEFYYVDSFYVNPNYVDYCIDPYYVTGEPPEDAAPLHHRIPTPQPLKQLKLWGPEPAASVAPGGRLGTPRESGGRGAVSITVKSTGILCDKQ